ncbi:MAG: amino acid adenylation domain-containing protein [Chthoniobacterales bacterium]|nr:amino acid adenylation domain-containing protein [Chthoniobacterales bacterium]
MNEGIAVIGYSGRFPGAPDVETFWKNLAGGIETITRFAPEETEFSVTGSEGVSGNVVRARGVLRDVDLFDAGFFGIYPKEAAVMDPQHRIFLECAWEAAEAAGYDPSAFPGMIGVYAGASLNTYLLYNLGGAQARRLAGNYQVGEYTVMLGNDKDFLPGRVAYKLNLRGPALAVQSACSSSLVAICQACTALQTWQCDMALAGGVSITFPQRRDYRYVEEGMVSPDGTCRSFDAEARGTVFGHGCGVVMLKRLGDALAEGDTIHAVLKGWAVNNDGSEKIGFAAPGVQAQADVIALAQAAADIPAERISYIEAHGTGTPLGDPIEVEALTRAFREGGASKKGFCAIGTGKTHIGHLDVAAGAVGLIKTLLQLKHEKIPGLLHFQSPNPRIPFSESPFFPVTRLLDWKRGAEPRCAGVSAFGVGGTNAHVVVEEAPALPAPYPSRRSQLLVVSAKSPTALEKMCGNLADACEAGLADVAYTLAKGRRGFPFRRAIVAADRASAADLLREKFQPVPAADNPRIAFLFPGQGSQQTGMGRELYETEEVFRQAVDACAGHLLDPLGADLRKVLFPAEGEGEEAARRIHETHFTQPAIFVFEYALAQQWIQWGIRPDLLIGHSIGEYVAAVLSGVFPLERALWLLAQRARLMQSLPSGAMLGARMASAELSLPEGLSLAATNSPKLVTLSGPKDAIRAYQFELEARKIPSRQLETSHAFHSAMMDPILPEFTRLAAGVASEAPTIPWISTLLGRMVSDGDLKDGTYWARQLREPVQFASAVEAAGADFLFLECGPGRALSQFVRQTLTSPQAVIASAPGESGSLGEMQAALGGLWCAGAVPDWDGYFSGETRRRVPLPTYPFERQSFWVVPPVPGAEEQVEPTEPPETDFLEAPVSEVVAVDRHAELVQLLSELSGLPVTDPGSRFVDLGFDSLFLTQFSQALLTRYGVKVTFRELLGEVCSVTKLAGFLSDKVPATTPVVPASAGKHTSGLPVVRWPEGQPPPAEAGPRFGPFKPPEKNPGGGLTERQQAALEKLISRYVSRTAGSKAYAAANRQHYADPRAVAGFHTLWKEMVYPIVAAGSKGSRITDIDGNSYIDVTMGFGTYFFGHSPDWLLEALQARLAQGIEIGPQSDLAGGVARDLCAMTGMERVTFCNTGSEAVMAAVRLARTVTGRQRVAYFSGDYHGMYDEVLVRGAWVNGTYRARPVAPGIPDSLIENMLVLEYGSPASLEILRAHAGELAAVLVEPVQSRRPDFQPRGFLQELRAITGQSGTALIFDEVVTGFRCHPGGAQAWFGIEADMATYGKVVGGGIPIGILAGKRPFMDALDGGAWNYGDDSVPEVGVTFFAGTFVRHPLAMAAARAVLDHLRQESPGLQLRMTERTALLARTLEANFAAAGVPLRLPHFSAVAGIEYPHELPHASLLWYYLRDKGIHIWEGRPIYLTSAHTDEDFDRIVVAFRDSVGEMQEAGFLPPPSGRTTLALSGEFPRADRVPITEAQREIWASVQMGDDANRAFNESCAIEFTGALDRSALEKALRHILQRHEALRSTFAEDGAWQIFPPAPEEVDLPVTDLSGLPEEDREAAYERERAKCTAHIFDLVAGPLTLLQLVVLAPNRHALLFTAHHLVCDGWAFGMIVDELSKSYSAFRQGRIPMLPPPMPFGDYARTLRAEADENKHQADRDYWVGLFRDLPPALDLPLDAPRPPLKSSAGAMETLILKPEQFARLKKVAPGLGGTFFATLLAAFGVLLHRLSGQDDIVIGVPSAGQTLVGYDALVGHCLNFLPVRLRCGGDQAFDAFAAAVGRDVLAAYEHQNYTFGSLVRELKIPRDVSRLPLVSVMFNIDKSGFDALSFDGLDFRVLTNAKQFVNFDLFFNLQQGDDRLEVECEYNTDLFSRGTIRRWLASFESLLDGLLDGAGIPLAQLPVLGAEEAHILREDWNATSREYDREVGVQELVTGVAATQPDSTAVCSGGGALSYRQLEDRATRIAAHLQALGVQSGDLVGLCLERSVDMVAGLLGILKTGAAYVPMDPLFPAERLGWMIEDARMPVLLTQRSLQGTLPPHQARMLLVEEVSDAGPLPEFVAARRGGEHPAYVIFTSGSTGRPKGVRIPHRAFVNFLNAMRDEPGFGPGDVLLSVTTISFDISGLEIFLPLISGGRLEIATRETTQDGNLLREALTRSGASVMQATPTTWRLLIEAGWKGSPNLKGLIGGEAVPRELVNQLAPLCGSLWNMYGPTETTIWSTVSRLEAGEGPVPIGHPIANTQVYIVNSALQIQPIGSVGELLIGGDGVALDYLDLPELTAEKFLPNPFVRSGGRLYRTGDMARWLSDGSLECLGRLDNQIKVRGFRIEPGEIEARLERNPRVAQAVVHVHEGRLCAWIRTEDAPPEKTTEQWRNQWDNLFQTAVDQAGSRSIDRLDAVITSWTGLENAEGQVEEWIETTIRRIESFAPKRILEIGCGTGQLLSRLAPTSECYWAADISRVAINMLEKKFSQPNVKFFCREAADFSGLPAAFFDTILINSVAQYFPEEGYLRRVLEQATGVLQPGGRIFVGDVQSHALLPVYHLETMLRRAEAPLACGVLRQRTDQRVLRETELCIDPAWFEDFAGARSLHAEISLRRGRIANETTIYHYDAILHSAANLREIGDWTDATDCDPAKLRAKLAGRPDCLAVCGIPDARLFAPLALFRAVQSAPSEAPPPVSPPGTDSGTISAEELFSIAEESGYRAHVRWQDNGLEGLLEAVFVPTSDSTLPHRRERQPSSGPWANTPTHNFSDERTSELFQGLRAELAGGLPDYMIPAIFQKVEAFPLTPNGKVDRRALPPPEETAQRAVSQPPIAPGTANEILLADIWSQVLGVHPVGIQDDIFELGGDSIFIFQMTSRAAAAGLPITPAQVFRHRTIVKILENLNPGTSGASTAGIPKADRNAYRRKS